MVQVELIRYVSRLPRFAQEALKTFIKMYTNGMGFYPLIHHSLQFFQWIKLSMGPNYERPNY